MFLLADVFSPHNLNFSPPKVPHFQVNPLPSLFLAEAADVHDGGVKEAN